MKVLILSSSTGGGHNAAGAAIQEALRDAGHEALLMDMFTLSGPRTADMVGSAYVNVARTAPHFFGFLYRIAGIISSPKRKSPVYYANGLMAKKLFSYLAENPCDAIVMPHLFPAETITYMKKHHMSVPLCVAVATDYTCIPFWEETDCDYYILPHEDLIPEYVSKKIPEEKLIPFGIPTGKAFCVTPDKKAAREKLHLPADKPLYLIMSGSMGFGKLHLFTYELVQHLKNGEHIIIICGSNEKLKRTLKKQFFRTPGVHIIGYTSQVADFMAACDVIYTKPGGLTSTEALNMHIPIVHTAPIPGCENKNRDFFVSRGMSIAAERVRTQVSQGMLLVENAAVRNGMYSAQQSNAHKNAAKDICRFLEEKTGKAR